MSLVGLNDPSTMAKVRESIRWVRYFVRWGTPESFYLSALRRITDGRR